MADMTEITCKCGCGRKKEVRTADVKRGWGLFYSKSCKAKRQEKRTGQYKKFIHRPQRVREFDPEDDMHPHDTYSLGQE